MRSWGSPTWRNSPEIPSTGGGRGAKRHGHILLLTAADHGQGDGVARLVVVERLGESRLTVKLLPSNCGDHVSRLEARGGRWGTWSYLANDNAVCCAGAQSDRQRGRQGAIG